MQPAYDVIVVGGGQAGLAMGYHLQQQHRRFLILDAGPEAGHAWRTRWDSLVLFTPSEFSTLPGLDFPLPDGTHPTKDDAADYLARYVKKFDMPVLFGSRVTALGPAAVGFEVRTADGRSYTAQQVVIATGPFNSPNIPSFADQLAEDIFQIHSSAYKNPPQLPEGPVLVVGGANSGAQIAEEMAPVTLSRRSKLPWVPGFMVSSAGFRLAELFGAFDITVESWLGQRLSGGDAAVFGVNLRALDVHLVGETVDADGHTVTFAGGEQMQPRSIVWATGFKPQYNWVNFDIFDEAGRPCHQRGVTDVPGLYFLGLSWLWTRGSALMGFVERDAAYLAEQIEQLHSKRSAAALSPNPQ